MLKKITYYISREQFEFDVNHGITDFILSSQELSRNGVLSLNEINSLLNSKDKFQEKVNFHLEWDVLFTENDFHKSVACFNQIDAEKLTSVRAQDYGVINFIKENHPNIKISIILETANHNFHSIKYWLDYLGPQCFKVILSPELNSKLVQEYSAKLKSLNILVEVYAFGPILLFYSPRSLLAKRIPVFDKALNLSATSEESPHKCFPLIENTHGTFMYNTKDLCLLEYIDELEQNDVSFIKIDLRQLHQNKKINHASFSKLQKAVLDLDTTTLKKHYPNTLIKGFYRANKTDVLFTKLKNQRLAYKDENYLGEILDVQKNEYLAISIKNKNHLSHLNSETRLQITTPEGKLLVTKMNNILNSNLTPFDAKKDIDQNLLLIKHMKGVSIRSAVSLLS